MKSSFARPRATTCNRVSTLSLRNPGHCLKPNGEAPIIVSVSCATALPNLSTLMTYCWHWPSIKVGRPLTCDEAAELLRISSGSNQAHGVAWASATLGQKPLASPPPNTT
jgi:hypothetical protein